MVSTRDSNDVVAVGVDITARAGVAVLGEPGSGTGVGLTLGWGGSGEGGQGGDGRDESELHCDECEEKCLWIGRECFDDGRRDWMASE